MPGNTGSPSTGMTGMPGNMPGVTGPTGSTGATGLTGNEKDEKALLLKLLTKYAPSVVPAYNQAVKNAEMAKLKAQLYKLEHPDDTLTDLEKLQLQIK